MGCRGIHSPTRTKNIGEHGRGLSQPELMGRETWFKWLESSVNEMVRECRILSVLFINKAMTTCMSPYDQTIDYKPSCLTICYKLWSFLLHGIFPFPLMSHVSSTSTVNHLRLATSNMTCTRIDYLWTPPTFLTKTLF